MHVRQTKGSRPVSSKCFGLTALGLLLIALASTAGAQTAGTKIGYVDVYAIQERSQSIQTSLRSAENQLKSQQEALELKLQRFNRSRDDLNAPRSVLSETEFRREEAKVQAMADEIDQGTLAIKKLERRIGTEIMEPAVSRIMEAIKQVGRQRGFQLIVASEAVLFGVEALDVTPLVVAALDNPDPRRASPAVPPPSPRR